MAPAPFLHWVVAKGVFCSCSQLAVLGLADAWPADIGEIYRPSQDSSKCILLCFGPQLIASAFMSAVCLPHMKNNCNTFEECCHHYSNCTLHVHTAWQTARNATQIEIVIGRTDYDSKLFDARQPEFV